ncbi:PAS domain S-box protein, partial [Longimicrobium sp.]|uniref:PAS domain S-box protein n=1 Tax=Longimicrobium sp. TaxID=2029185 RepID=UPI002E337D77
MRGMRIQALLPEDAAPHLEAALARAARTGELATVEYRREAGAPHEYEARVVPLADGSLISVIRDITERKGAERELERRRREAEQVAETLRQQALVFETLAEAVVITDAEGRVRDWNPAAERMFGDHHPAAVGRPGGLVRPGHEPGIADAVRAALGGDGSWTGEVPFTRADGTEGVADAVVVPQTDAAGRRVALISAYRDVTARKQAEAEVVRQKAFFEEIIASLESGVAVFDTELRYHYASPNSIVDPEIRAWTVGRTVREYGERKGLPEEIIRKRENGLRAAIRTRKASDFEETIRGPDGKPRHVIRRSLPVLDEAGDILRIIGYSVDITERVRMAEVLRQSEEHFRALIENAHDITCIMDAQGVITYQSPSMSRLLGWEPDDIIGRPAWTLMHPDDVPGVRAAMAEILAAPGTSRVVEYRFRHRDGEWRMLEAIGRTLSPDTAEQGLVANIRDVTERQQAELALQEREEHFRQLIENAHDITCILGVDGTMSYLSPSILRVLGYPPEALEGQICFAYMHPEDVAAVVASIQGVLGAPGSTGYAEYRFRHADGSWRHLEAVGRMVVPGDPAEGFVLNIRDVTERREAEEALREATLAAERARSEAERANLAKSEFLSRMSHELRTPMNSILGFGQVLARAELRVDQQKHVQHILKAGRHLLRLINEVLEIARIEAGRQSFSLEPVHVGTVMAEAIGLVRPMAEQHDVEVEEGASTGRDGFVHADRQRLTQVLLNLLSNAIKYNRTGGRVRLTCQADPVGEDGEPQVWLRVEDSGHGIPEARLHQLFTPFARLGAEQTEVEGTGLGLALSLRLAEAM